MEAPCPMTFWLSYGTAAVMGFKKSDDEAKGDTEQKAELPDTTSRSL